MQFETKISPFDMKDLLISLIGSPLNFDVSTLQGERYEGCGFQSLDTGKDVVVISSSGKSVSLKVSAIQSIEFAGFHKYKSVCSKIFTID